jgi:hypothetical protein
MVIGMAIACESIIVERALGSTLAMLPFMIEDFSIRTASGAYTLLNTSTEPSTTTEPMFSNMLPPEKTV